jgi:hypothetical protein
MFVAIHATQTDGAPVDEKATLPNLDAAESHLLLQLLADITQTVLEG